MRSSRVPVLAAVLVFACLLVASSASAQLCRYFCGGTIREGSATNCCTATFQCPDGQTVRPYGYHDGLRWRICGFTTAAAADSCEPGAVSAPEWLASEADPAEEVASE